jgi:hypothetical protein
MVKKTDDQYDPKEAQKRMVAALRGARLAGHMPMKVKKAAKKSKPQKRPSK